MKTFWDERYSSEDYVYGEAPNRFIQAFLDEQPAAGRLLLPAEGEGRNAVYAARLGWTVDAFDFSPVARDKALRLAERAGVMLNYIVGDVASFDYGQDRYDAVGLSFVHLSAELRRLLHEQIAACLRPGGAVVLEAFTPDQLQYTSGGPRQADWLYNRDILEADFQSLHIELLEECTVELSEGPYHRGTAAVVRLIARKD